MTYAQFEVATSSGLGGNAFTGKFIILMTFDVDPRVMQNVVQYPLRHATYAAAKLEVSMSNN